jgi:type IV secretory pathway TraG/TraD family ATPase VirD4
MADYNVVDQTREAKTTIVLASQAERSFVPILGKDIKNTLVDNLGNELIFTVTNQEDAEEAAKRIGSRPIQKKSTSHSNKGSTRSYSEQVEAFIRPHELRSLRKHECVARHCEGRWHRIKLAPTAHTQPSTEAEREPGQTAQS